jgi:hypothetical protein
MKYFGLSNLAALTVQIMFQGSVVVREVFVLGWLD